MVSAGKVTIDIEANTSNFNTGLKAAEGSALNFKNVLETALGFGLAQITGRAIGFMKDFAVESTKASMEFQERFSYFSRLVEGDAQSFMRVIQESAGMTISQLESVGIANRALMLGISQDQMPKLVQVSKILGDVMGIDTVEAVNMLTMGMTRNSERMFTSLGIIKDLDSVYQKYKDSIGLTTGELDSEQKSLAVLNEVMRRSDELIKQFGDSKDTAKDKAEQLTSAYADMHVELGNLGTALLVDTGILETFTMGIRGTIHDIEWLRTHAPWYQGEGGTSPGGMEYAKKTYAGEEVNPYIDKLGNQCQSTAEKISMFGNTAEDAARKMKEYGETRGYQTGMTREEFLNDTQRGRTDVIVGVTASNRYSEYRSAS